MALFQKLERHFFPKKCALKRGALKWHSTVRYISELENYRILLLLSSTPFLQLYENEAGDLYDILAEKNSHKRFFYELNSLVLFYAFDLETWDVDSLGLVTKILDLIQ